MSNENPYAEYLGDQEPLKILSLTARKIEAILEDLGSERVDHPPAPGKWSAREIVCHLADCELVFAFRLRQTLSEDHHVIQPFDQEKWAANYAAYNTREALSNLSFNAELEPGPHPFGDARRSRQTGRPSGTRHDDFSDHRRDDGWARHQSPAPARCNDVEVRACIISVVRRRLSAVAPRCSCRSGTSGQQRSAPSSRRSAADR